MCGTKAEGSFAGLRQLFAVPPPGLYAGLVRKATRTLRDSFFGTWQGTDDLVDADGNVIGTVPNMLKDKFDKNFWEWVSDDTWVRALRVRAGKSPAAAIDAILTNLTAWRIDCDHTVQISNLFATSTTLGAAKFDALVGPQMLLRDRDSVGLKTVAHVGRDFPTDAWRVVVAFVPNRVTGNPPRDIPFDYAGGSLPDTTEQLLARASAGSRVRFTNRQAPTFSPFRHENCVKLGPDLYAAGGIDDPITGNEFTRERLEILLAQMTTPAPSVAYIRQNIYIDEIETFEHV